ncbi:MAG: hypothetical protein ACKVOQ_16095 [Cyclobacteriaceae bacterium]
MRTYKTLLSLSAFALSFSCLLLSSCKKDEAPPAKPKLSMKEATRTVKESDGEIEIKMKLDKGAFEDFKVTYELSGTAVDKVTAGTTKPYDYEITSDYLSTKITKDDSIGVIKVKLRSDFEIEDPETIIISIKTVDSNNVEITRNDDIKITVNQDDGMVVALEWGIGAGEKYTDVDMDLFLWGKGTSSTLVITNVSSTRLSVVSPEFFFLPLKAVPDGAYGLSCNYYSGKQDPMNFSVSFIKLVNSTFGTPTVKKGTYTLANINAYDQTKIDPLLVQTFDKTNGDFTNFSDITIPSKGSRIGYGNTIPQKQTNDQSKNDLILRLLNRK